MAQPTNIEWTEQSWNFLRGCRRVSEACGSDRGGGCYAERQAIRQAKPGEAYHGLVVSTPKGPRWTGEIAFVEEILLAPLKRRKPTTYFVNSMSDLFYEKVTDEMIDKAFAVMALTPQHNYQVLTKRPDRMREYFEKIDKSGAVSAGRIKDILYRWPRHFPQVRLPKTIDVTPAYESFHWPLPNVWLGVSVEDQKTADERIPLLLQTPAALRWLSIEPLLGPVDLKRALFIAWQCSGCSGYFPHPYQRICPACGRQEYWTGSHAFNPRVPVHPDFPGQVGSGIDWVVVGGESGPRARSCDIGWIRSILTQCKAAGVPAFVKQLGAAPFEPARYQAVGDAGLYLSDRKGGKPCEWPEDLRVREMPEVASE